MKALNWQVWKKAIIEDLYSNIRPIPGILCTPIFAGALVCGLKFAFSLQKKNCGHMNVFAKTATQGIAVYSSLPQKELSFYQTLSHPLTVHLLWDCISVDQSLYPLKGPISSYILFLIWKDNINCSCACVGRCDIRVEMKWVYEVFGFYTKIALNIHSF